MEVLKLHYLIWFGCLAGVLPYVSLLAKNYTTASATDVGILFTILPFVASIVKPLFCSVADRRYNHKKILLISLMVTLVGYGLLLTVPYIQIANFSWYWFCLLVFFANSSMGVVISLTDYLVVKESSELNKSFGSYRVYGTVGWGFFGLLAGFVNEKLTFSYLIPGLIMFTIGISFDIVLIWTSINKAENQPINERRVDADSPTEQQGKGFSLTWLMQNIVDSLKNIFRIFRLYPSLIRYSMIVMVFGILTAFFWIYYFWYLQEIRGKDPWLIGLCLFVQCFLGELPFFLIAHKIVNYCGASLSLNLSLGVFVIRYFLYGYVLKKQNLCEGFFCNTYWDVLIVEVCQGPNFGLFYCVMTALAKHYADKISRRSDGLFQHQADGVDVKSDRPIRTTHATMQGLMSGCYEGLGLGIGSLVGGIIIDQAGIFSIWRVAALIGLITLIFNIIFDIAFVFVKKRSI